MTYSAHCVPHNRLGNLVMGVREMHPLWGAARAAVASGANSTHSGMSPGEPVSPYPRARLPPRMDAKRREPARPCEFVKTRVLLGLDAAAPARDAAGIHQDKGRLVAQGPRINR